MHFIMLTQQPKILTIKQIAMVRTMVQLLGRSLEQPASVQIHPSPFLKIQPQVSQVVSSLTAYVCRIWQILMYLLRKIRQYKKGLVQELPKMQSQQFCKKYFSNGPKVANFSGNYFQTFWHQDLSKIAKCGHTVNGTQQDNDMR